jgi:predicted ester cyclase
VEIRELVQLFYEKFWNECDLGIAAEILDPNVTFRGSLGSGASGIQEVCDYVLMVTTALSGYRCEIEVLITEGDRAAAKVRFSGLHTGEFLGHLPTERHLEWIGTAFFAKNESKLSDIWVLGDLDSLRAQLEEQT